MKQSKDSEVLSVVHPVCCGIDVHKELVVACVLTPAKGGSVEKIIKEFRTFTDDLFELKEWLRKFQCPIVAMESTGIYWQPLHNVLENDFEIVLVNARHMKNVPGRKTDVSDSQWITELLRHGLLKSSFIPLRHVRQWRDLSRLKKKQISTVSSY
jgi:transposase